MWWLLLRFVGVRDAVGFVVRLAMFAAFVVTVIAALYALGLDPIGIAYDWFVGLVEQAVRDAVGGAI
jgi:hypothetical protein